jgi:hypothetical protein
MVATAGLLLLHEPPATVELSATVPDRQTVERPLMAPAVGVDTTVTAWLATMVPQLLVAV